MSAFRVQRFWGRANEGFSVWNDPVENESLARDRRDHASWVEEPASWLNDLHWGSNSWPNGIVLRAYGIPSRR